MGQVSSFGTSISPGEIPCEKCLNPAPADYYSRMVGNTHSGSMDWKEGGSRLFEGSLRYRLLNSWFSPVFEVGGYAINNRDSDTQILSLDPRNFRNQDRYSGNESSMQGKVGVVLDLPLSFGIEILTGYEKRNHSRKQKELYLEPRYLYLGNLFASLNYTTLAGGHLSLNLLIPFFTGQVRTGFSYTDLRGGSSKHPFGFLFTWSGGDAESFFATRGAEFDSGIVYDRFSLGLRGQARSFLLEIPLYEEPDSLFQISVGGRAEEVVLTGENMVRNTWYMNLDRLRDSHGTLLQNSGAFWKAHPGWIEVIMKRRVVLKITESIWLRK